MCKVYIYNIGDECDAMILNAVGSDGGVWLMVVLVFIFIRSREVKLNEKLQAVSIRGEYIESFTIPLYIYTQHNTHTYIHRVHTLHNMRYSEF